MKNKRNFIVLVIALILVFYFTTKDDFVGIINQLSNINIKIFLLAIIIFLTALFFKSISLYIYLRQYKKNYPLKKAYYLTLIGQFLNGITPFQSGGQPFQIYLLKKEGIKISDSTNAMIKDFLSFQIALVTMGIVAIILNSNMNILNDVFSLKTFVLFGFLINFVVLLFLIIILCSKKSLIKLVNKFIDFIFKFRIMSKIGLNKEDLTHGVNNFYRNGKELRKSKVKLLITVLINLINLFLLYTIPFVIFKSFDVSGISILDSIIVITFVTLIGNFIPIPGATGGIEYSFLRLFGSFTIKSTILSSVMLVWRFITYIFGMFVGLITLIITKGVDKKCE